MRTRLSKIVVSVAVIAAPIACWATPAAAATTVGCGSTVSGHATLKHDLHCHGDGVTLLSGTLNLNHHTISGDGTGNGIAVAGGKATIKNGSIAKFGTGVTATVDDAVVTLDYVTISRVTWTAVDGTTINTANLSHVNLRDNKGDALVVIAPNQATVSHSTITRNGRGIVLVVDGQADVKDSVIDSNGVGLDCSQGVATVNHSVVSRNDTGVSLAECESSSFTASGFVGNRGSAIAETEAYASPGQATLTVTRDVFFQNGTGLQLSAAGRADVVRDSLFAHNRNGIVASCGFACDEGLVPDDQLISNYFASNSADGASWGYGTVTVTGNRFVDNGGWGFTAGPGATVTDGGGNVAHGNHAGNCSGLSCS
jgi:hypothetical protein